MITSIKPDALAAKLLTDIIAMKMQIISVSASLALVAMELNKELNNAIILML